jgi:hypothetical protein
MPSTFFKAIHTKRNTENCNTKYRSGRKHNSFKFSSESNKRIKEIQKNKSLKIQFIFYNTHSSLKCKFYTRDKLAAEIHI